MPQPNFEVALTKSICPVCAKTFDGDLVISKQATDSANNYVKSLQGKITKNVFDKKTLIELEEFG